MMNGEPVLSHRSPGAVHASLAVGFSALLVFALTGPALAHVKWFAPYIVGAPPQPIGNTLANAWFWTRHRPRAGVLPCDPCRREVERWARRSSIGMDRVTEPLWKRLDDFVRVVIGAFFVAIFAVGGVYLTPDLKTPAEWVSWTAAADRLRLIFSRKTQPLAAAGIIVLCGCWRCATTTSSTCSTISRSASASPAISCWRRRTIRNGASTASRCCAGASPSR